MLISRSKIISIVMFLIIVAISVCSPISAIETQAKQQENVPPHFDPITERYLKTLLPAVERRARVFLQELKDDPKSDQIMTKDDLEIKVIAGTRSYQEQNRLYAQGRTRPGMIVTNARGGYSNHNFGLAFDIGVFIDGEYSGDDDDYDQFAPIGKKHKFEWGGDWTFIDKPHYQWPVKLTMAQMREIIRKGGKIQVDP